MSESKPRPVFLDGVWGQDALKQFHDHGRAAQAAFPGPNYLEWLRWLHDRLRPRWYCEIGVEYGRSFELIRPETQAVGIDPVPRIERPPTSRAKLFPMRSDDFFLAGSANTVLGDERFDFGFIDGLHVFDQVVRDFVHLERFSRADAVIAIHDVLPLCEDVATPLRRTLFWTGDAFRALLVLAELRPDLRVAAIPCFPSGLALITGLNPQNVTDTSAYAAAVAAWDLVAFDVAMAELKRRVAVLPNEFTAVAHYLALGAREAP